jgi:predicted HicB family RNase H-like nuclease
MTRALDKLADAVMLSVWVPRKLHKACKAAAKRDKRSLSNWLRLTLEQATKEGKP